MITLTTIFSQASPNPSYDILHALILWLQLWIILISLLKQDLKELISFKLGLAVYIVSKKIIYFFAIIIEVGIHYTKIAKNEILSCFNPQLCVSEDSVEVVVYHRSMDPAFLIIEESVRLVIIKLNYESKLVEYLIWDKFSWIEASQIHTTDCLDYKRKTLYVVNVSVEIDDIQRVVAIDHPSLPYHSPPLLLDVLDKSLPIYCIIEKDITWKQSLATHHVFNKWCMLLK